MLGVNIGPLALSLGQALLLGAFVIALIVGAIMGLSLIHI